MKRLAAAAPWLAPTIVMTALLLVTVIAQGGFYGDVTCACGILAALSCIVTALYRALRGRRGPGARTDATAQTADAGVSAQPATHAKPSKSSKPSKSAASANAVSKKPSASGSAVRAEHAPAVSAIPSGAQPSRAPLGSWGIPLVPALFALLAMVYLVSALANTPTFTSLSETGTWFATAAVALLAFLQPAAARSRTFDALCWAGAVGAVLALLMYAEFFPWPYSMNEDRLQFFHQYANAAAAWFGVTALLAVQSDKLHVRALVCLPVCGMLLTESGGALLVFALVLVALVVQWWRAAAWERIAGLVFQLFVAAVAFVVANKVDNGLACLLSIGELLLAAWLYARADAWAPAWASQKRTAACLAGVTALAIVLLLVLYRDRAIEAAGHLAARVVYLYDAACLVATSPILGLGPDNWQFHYLFTQSAQYSISVVHNSYAQAAVDAGLVGLAALLITVAAGAASLMGAGAGRALLPYVLLALHAFFDFDLQFGSLAFMLAFLGSNPDGIVLCFGRQAGAADDAGGAGKAVDSALAAGDEVPASAANASRRVASKTEELVDAPGTASGSASSNASLAGTAAGKTSAAQVKDDAAAGSGAAVSRKPRNSYAATAVIVIVSLLLAAGCVVGLSNEMSKQQLIAANVHHDYVAAGQVYQGNPLAYNDIIARANFLEAAYGSGAYGDVVASWQLHGVQSARQALCVADALLALGRPDDAISLLIDMMGKQPYNAGLFARAYNMANGQTLSHDVAQRYSDAVYHSNVLSQQGLAVYVPNQLWNFMPPLKENLGE